MRRNSLTSATRKCALYRKLYKEDFRREIIATMQTGNHIMRISAVLFSKIINRLKILCSVVFTESPKQFALFLIAYLCVCTHKKILIRFFRLKGYNHIKFKLAHIIRKIIASFAFNKIQNFIINFTRCKAESKFAQ